MTFTEIHITIPNPCKEDWKKMTTNAEGKFCSRCSKTVIDFTYSTKQEIYSHLLEHPNTCGRIRSPQLLSTSKHILAQFARAAFLVFGMSLFFYSCKMESPAANLITLTEQELNLHDNKTLQIQEKDTLQKIRNNEKQKSALTQAPMETPLTTTFLDVPVAHLEIEPNIFLNGDISYILGSITPGNESPLLIAPEITLPDHLPRINSPYVKANYSEDGIITLHITGLPLDPYEKSIYEAKVDVYKNWTEPILTKELEVSLPLSNHLIEVGELEPGSYNVVLNLGKHLQHCSFTINNKNS